MVSNEQIHSNGLKFTVMIITMSFDEILQQFDEFFDARANFYKI